MSIQYKFICSEDEEDYLMVNTVIYEEFNNAIRISGKQNGENIDIHFDIHTAVKFSKTLQSKIREAKEVHNG